MFGRSWQGGEATILERRLLEVFRGGEAGQPRRRVFEYIADVRPDSGARAFRATIPEPSKSLLGLVEYRDSFESPNTGQTVRVRFRPRDQKVEFDKTEWSAPAGSSAAGAAPETAERGTSAQADRLERLDALAELHARGVLDDVELATETAKILGEG